MGQNKRADKSPEREGSLSGARYMKGEPTNARRLPGYARRSQCVCVCVLTHRRRVAYRVRKKKPQRHHHRRNIREKKIKIIIYTYTDTLRWTAGHSRHTDGFSGIRTPRRVKPAIGSIAHHRGTCDVRVGKAAYLRDKIF